IEGNLSKRIRRQQIILIQKYQEFALRQLCCCVRSTTKTSFLRAQYNLHSVIRCHPLLQHLGKDFVLARVICYTQLPILINLASNTSYSFLQKTDLGVKHRHHYGNQWKVTLDVRQSFSKMRFSFVGPCVDSEPNLVSIFGSR